MALLDEPAVAPDDYQKEMTIMAKQKQPAPASGGMRGKKPCPHCGALNGARAKTCRSCGRDIPYKKAKARDEGGLAQSIRQIELLRAFVQEQGGYDAAGKQLDRLAELVSACGSLDELRAGVGTLQEWEKSFGQDTDT